MLKVGEQVSLPKSAAKPRIEAPLPASVSTSDFLLYVTYLHTHLLSITSIFSATNSYPRL